METKKIVNLLNNFDNQNSKFATKNGMLLTVRQKVILHTKIQSNLQQSQLSQIFVIILMHIF